MKTKTMEEIAERVMAAVRVQEAAQDLCACRTVLEFAEAERCLDLAIEDFKRLYLGSARLVQTGNSPCAPPENVSKPEPNQGDT